MVTKGLDETMPAVVRICASSASGMAIDNDDSDSQIFSNRDQLTSDVQQEFYTEKSWRIIEETKIFFKDFTAGIAGPGTDRSWARLLG